MASATFASAFRQIWGILIVIALYWSLYWFIGGVLPGFFRALVVCSSSGPDAPLNCRMHPDQCVPHPPSSENWSGSDYCFDREQVLLESTQQLGTFFSLTTGIMVLALPVLGALADVKGRKPFVVLGLCATTILGAFFSVAAFSLAPLAWVYSGVAVSSGFNCFESASISMVADSSEQDANIRGTFMASIFICKQIAICAAFAFAYWVLSLDLTDYSYVWIAYTAYGIICAVFAQLVLKETFVRKIKEGAEGAVQRTVSFSEDGFFVLARTVFVNLREGVMLILKDRFLVGFFVCITLGTLASFGSMLITGSFLIGVFNYSQSVASLGGIVQQPCVLFGVVITKRMIDHPKVGLYVSLAIGFVIIVTSFLVMGLAPSIADRNLAQIAWWSAFLVLGVSYGIFDTCRTTLVSMRVKEENQAKVQGVMLTFYLLGQAVGQLIWGHYVYDPNAKGIFQGSSFLLSSAVCAVVLCMYAVIMTWCPPNATARGNSASPLLQGA